MVNLVFGWNSLVSLERLSSSWHVCVIYLFFIKVSLHWNDNVFFHFRDINIWKNYRDGTSNQALVNLFCEPIVNWKYTFISWLCLLHSLFCMSKRGHCRNKEKYFYFTSKALFVLEIIKHNFVMKFG